jgi:hypothetical protein
MNTHANTTDKETLTLAERAGELAVIAAMLLLAGFFAYHQLARTGYFTAAFGPLEMLCLYGPIVVSFAAPIVRLATGQRNPARPLEAATSLFLGIGSLWLLIVFPFEFSHLGDVLPGPLHFLLGWFTNGLGRIALILQVIIGPVSAVLTMRKYASLRRRREVAGAA